MAYVENMVKTRKELDTKNLNIKCIEKRTLCICILKRVDTLLNKNRGKLFFYFKYLKGPAQSHKVIK
jgi:hypothetical protein